MVIQLLLCRQRHGIQNTVLLKSSEKFRASLIQLILSLPDRLGSPIRQFRFLFIFFPQILLLIVIRSVLIWYHLKFYVTGSAGDAYVQNYWSVELLVLPSVIHILIGIILVHILSVFIFPLSKFRGWDFCKVGKM